jgi:hypothetical protein
MAVKKETTISRYIGLASDTKPTGVEVGSTFFEYDTGILWITHDGTNWVVKDVQPLAVAATGSAAIATSVTPAVKFRLLRVELHLNAAPTTSEDFTITLNAGAGAAYDVVLLKRDLTIGSLTDLIAVFGEGYEFESDDVIDIAWANTDARTYGLRALYEVI